MTQRPPDHALWIEPGLPGTGRQGRVGFLPFLAVALLLHLAVFGVSAPGSSSAGGVGGDAAISLQGATAAITAMVAEWERPPTVTPPPDSDALDPAQSDTLPPLADARSDQSALGELAVLPVVTERPAVPPRLGTPATDLPAPRPEAFGLPAPAQTSDAATAAARRLTTLPPAAASRTALPDSRAPLPPLAMPAAPALPGEPPAERAAAEPRLPEPPLSRLSGLAPLPAPAPMTEHRTPAEQAVAPAPVNSAPPPPAGALDGRAQQLAPERSRLPEPRPAQPAAQPPAPSRNAQSARPATPPRQTAPAPAPAATPPAQTAAPAASAAPSARAAGSGAAPRDGASGRAAATSRAGGDSAALVAQWGGAIRAAVQRQQRHPQGVRSGGTVHLQLAVNANGQLASVQMTQSSGHAALDRAAMDAVRRARLPSAPQGLNGTYRFNLPVRFRG